MAVVVVGREMLVTALRGFIEQRGGDFSAKMAGKLKMVFQCVAGGFGLGKLMYADGTAPGWLQTILPAAWFAVLAARDRLAGRAVDHLLRPAVRRRRDQVHRRLGGRQA